MIVLVAAALAAPDLERWEACVDGEGAACRTVGEAIRDGGSDPWRTTRAATLFERACQLGDAGGCWRWFGGQKTVYVPQVSSKACEAGLADACWERLRSVGSLGERLVAAERLCATGDAGACELPAKLGLTQPGVERYRVLPGQIVEAGPDGTLLIAAEGGIVHLDPRRETSRQVPLSLDGGAIRWDEPGAAVAPALAAWGGRVLLAGSRVGATFTTNRPFDRCTVRWLDTGEEVVLDLPEDALCELLSWEDETFVVVATGNAERIRFAPDGRLVAREPWSPPSDAVPAPGGRTVEHTSAGTVVADGDYIVATFPQSARLLPGGDLSIGDVWVGLTGVVPLPATVDSTAWKARTLDDLRRTLAAYEGHRVRVEGQVVGPEGRPDGKVGVELAIEEGHHDRAWTLETDEEGRFSTELFEGEWAVRAVREGARGSWATLALEPTTPDVTLSLRVVPEELPVSGRVVTTDGRPAGGVLVEACGDRHWTDAAGMFACAYVPPVRDTVRVRLEPGDRREIAVPIQEKLSDPAPGIRGAAHPLAKAALDIVLEGERDEVTTPYVITDTCGQPVADVASHGRRSEADGTIDLPGPTAPEAYGFGLPSLRWPDGSPVLPRNARYDGDVIEVVVTAGTVRIGGALGSEGLLVGPDARIATRPGAVHRLHPGRWELWTLRPALAVRTFDLAPCTTERVRLRRARDPSPWGPLAVRVLDPDGWPVADAVVSTSAVPAAFRATWDEPLPGSTDARGEVVLEPVLRGRRMIDVAMDGFAPTHRLVYGTEEGQVDVVLRTKVANSPVYVEIWPHPEGLFVDTPNGGGLAQGDVILAADGRSLAGFTVAEGYELLAVGPVSLDVRDEAGERRVVAWPP